MKELLTNKYVLAAIGVAVAAAVILGSVFFSGQGTDNVSDNAKVDKSRSVDTTTTNGNDNQNVNFGKGNQISGVDMSKGKTETKIGTQNNNNQKSSEESVTTTSMDESVTEGNVPAPVTGANETLPQEPIE